MRAVALALTAAIAVPVSLDAYLHVTTTRAGQTILLRWDQMPIAWAATDRGAPGITASQFQATMARAFATWEGVPTAAVSFRFAGFTGADPFDDDDRSVLGFQDRPDLDRVLGATGFLVDVFTGDIVEADIFFNTTVEWSTAAGGDPGGFDLESVAVHEIGHLLGLGHSALGETEIQADGNRRVLASGSVMFPISFPRGITLDRELQPDDIAGVSDLYPAGGFRNETGVLRGRVVRNGAGVLGAHVIAFHQPSRRLVAGFTLNPDGEFEIAGLLPGAHVIRVEPLDDANIDSFFSAREPIDVGFRVTFHDRLFVAPSGGLGERVTVTVPPR